MLAQRRHLFSHQIPGVGKAKTVLINEIRLVFRLKTQHALPAINNAPYSAKCVEHRIQRCGSSQPGCRSMLMRQVIVKLVLIVFDSFQTSVFGIGVAGKAARVETPGIPLALTMHHQFCQYFPMATAFANAGAQADNTVGVLQPRYLPDQRQTVNGIGDRSVNYCMNSGILQHGHTLENTLHIVEAAIQIGRTQRLSKGRVNTIHAKGFAALLVDPDQQPLFLLTTVKIIARVANYRYLVVERLDFRQIIRQKVHMLHGCHRVFNTQHVADLVDPVATGIYHLLAGDIAIFRVHDKFTAGVATDVFNRVETIDVGTGFSRLARQCLGNAGRINVAVEWIPPGPD